MTDKTKQTEQTSVLDEAAYATDTRKRSHSLRDLLDKKLAWHADETQRLTALRDRTPNAVLDMVVADLTDILKM